jgi:hypothetical protein
MSRISGELLASESAAMPPEDEENMGTMVDLRLLLIYI